VSNPTDDADKPSRSVMIERASTGATDALLAARLRELYSDILTEPVPERLLSLLRKLDKSGEDENG